MAGDLPLCAHGNIGWLRGSYRWHRRQTYWYDPQECYPSWLYDFSKTKVSPDSNVKQQFTFGELSPIFYIHPYYLLTTEPPYFQLILYKGFTLYRVRACLLYNAEHWDSCTNSCTKRTIPKTEGLFWKSKKGFALVVYSMKINVPTPDFATLIKHKSDIQLCKALLCIIWHLWNQRTDKTFYQRR